MKHERGNWKVMRDCCQSGNCIECREVTPFGTSVRILQGHHYSEAYAKFVATGWSSYNAIAELEAE